VTRRHPAAWRPRDATYDPHVKAVVAQGFGKPVYWNGIETHERALEIKRGIHRSARFLKQSIRVDLTDADDGTITAVITAFDKEVARAYIKDQGRWNGR
jgi:hypothetical protein